VHASLYYKGITTHLLQVDLRRVADTTLARQTMVTVLSTETLNHLDITILLLLTDHTRAHDHCTRSTHILNQALVDCARASISLGRYLEREGDCQHGVNHSDLLQGAGAVLGILSRTIVERVYHLQEVGLIRTSRAQGARSCMDSARFQKKIVKKNGRVRICNEDDNGD